MKAVLFIVAFVALFAVATPLTCDNPFFRLLVAKPQWLFPYLTQSALQDVTEEVCPGFNGQETCCDEVVYRRLKNVWELVRADVLAVRVKLAVLQFEVDVLLAEIATLKKEVQQSTTLTDNEKAAIITFLDALATAVTPLVPDILNGFGQCYTAVLKFYAGLLCRACDPVWQDWVLLEGPSPLLDNFRFNFSQATCTGFSDACAPFFAPFYNFKNALISALEQLANNIPDNQTRADVVDRLEDYRPPCDSVNDCLQFICYKFLSGLDRDEDWSTDSFQNATVPGRRRHVMGTITEKVIRSLNKVQRSARQLTARDAGLSGTDYNGSFDPMKQQTTLNTDASTSPSSRVSQPFWFNFLNYFFTM